MKLDIGSIYWYQPENHSIPHPHVVVEIDEDTITLCSITTNMKKLSMPGIVVLDAGEGNLEKQSIVETYKTVSVTPSELHEYIGTLSERRVQIIQAGIKLIKQLYS